MTYEGCLSWRYGHADPECCYVEEEELFEDNEAHIEASSVRTPSPVAANSGAVSR